MGPRPFGRGREYQGARVGVVPEELQWGRDLSAAEGQAGPLGPAPFFYASMGPRPFGRGRVSRARARRAERQLQWGRDLSAAEGWRQIKRDVDAELLQWGRDLSAAEGC